MSLDAAAYQRAAARFGETIVELADEEWELTTHPDDWTVITTVAWVVVGDAQLSAAAAGQALQSVGEFDAAVLGGNPVAAWRGTAVRHRRASRHRSDQHDRAARARADSAR